MPDYTKGKIYKIVKKEDHTQCYVGSTTTTLHRRLKKHIDDAKQYPNRKFYLAVNGKWDEWDIILIEKYPCSSKKELEEKETEYRLEIGTLNIRIEGRKQQDYRDGRKDFKKEYDKEWRDKNKEILAKKNKEYYEKNKDKILKKVKEYSKKNKEVILEKKKEYSEKNRNEINRRRREANAKKKAQQNGLLNEENLSV